MVSQRTERERLGLVEMVEQLDVPQRYHVARERVTGVAPVAGEVDARVVAEDVCDVVGKAHGYRMTYIFRFVKSNDQERGNTIPGSWMGALMRHSTTRSRSSCVR